METLIAALFTSLPNAAPAPGRDFPPAPPEARRAVAEWVAADRAACEAAARRLGRRPLPPVEGPLAFAPGARPATLDTYRAEVVGRMANGAVVELAAPPTNPAAGFRASVASVEVPSVPYRVILLGDVGKAGEAARLSRFYYKVSEAKHRGEVLPVYAPVAASDDRESAARAAK